MTSFSSAGHTPPGGSAPLGNPPFGTGHTPPGGNPALLGGAPSGGGTPPGKHRKRMLIAVCATVATLLIAGVAMAVVTLDKGKNDTADKDHKPGRSNAPSSHASHSATPSTEPSSQTPATKPVTTGDVPDDYLGAWEGEVMEDGTATGKIRRFVLSQGTTGSEVADTLESAADAFCQETGTLKAKRSLLVIESKVSTGVPSDKCSDTGEQTLKLRPDGSMAWTDIEGSETATLRRTESGDEPIPAKYLGTWLASDAYGTKNATFKITIEQGAFGTGVATTLWQSDKAECTGIMRLVSVKDGELVLSTEEITRSVPEDQCSASNSITFHASGNDKLREEYQDENDESQTQTFTRLS
ncbi:hypothetical protein E4099_29805 [Streptomyces palmae]|uniref:Serine/threonine protein kinase n=3 Tax=Streptomyces palmae TaxID=1701085 RepID=A0A4Z0G0J2_9ACTN|nr:hypothetical protein E4099_29805 [Streptomyces palmae]